MCNLLLYSSDTTLLVPVPSSSYVDSQWGSRVPLGDTQLSGPPACPPRPAPHTVLHRGHLPSCPARCFLRRTPPCLGPGGRCPRNTPGPLRRSSRSWRGSWWGQTAGEGAGPGQRPAAPAGPRAVPRPSHLTPHPPPLCSWSPSAARTEAGPPAGWSLRPSGPGDPPGRPVQGLIPALTFRPGPSEQGS